MNVKKGDLVEFTDGYHLSYPPQQKSLIRYGVVIEDAHIDECKVKIADGSIVKPNYIWACRWAGWIPDGLELIMDELNPIEPFEY